MRAVVFDLDGTLIDSCPDICAALNRVLAANALAPLSADSVREMIGDGAQALLARGFAARGGVAQPRHLSAFIAEYEPHSAERTRPYPGIPAALAALHQAGYPLGVCTNKPERAARHILAALGLADHFSVVTGGDSTRFRKPDPRHLAVTLAGLGVAEAVMVGDHANDMQAAAGLSLPSVFVRWGYGQAQGTYSVDTADALPGLIMNMA